MKRGQITPFVIIGLVILALVGLLIIYGGTFDIENLRTIAIDEEIMGINDAVEECINTISLEALNIAGSQGGYIAVPQEGFASSVDPFVNRLIFGNFQIPYWFYVSSNNIEKEQVPSKSFMENEIEGYLKLNLNSCLNNFTEFKNQGYDITAGNIVINADIGKDTVIAEVNWPLSIEYSERNFRLDRFSRDLDIPLGRLYDRALEIFNDENENFFLEERTIDMLVVYDEIPYSETNFDCGVKIWTRTDVQNALKGAISQNIPAIKIKGTNYGNVEKYFEWNAIGGRENIDVNLMYLQDWPIEMDVFPREGEVLRSDQIVGDSEVTKLIGSFFCLNNYNFIYDIKYPVLVVLNKDGYVFQFSTMVVVDNNLPRENRLLRNFGNTDSRICDAKITPIQIFANAYDNNGNIFPLKDVSISYQCSTTKCDIGTTMIKGQNSILETEFPACLNGVVIGEKEGYHFDKQTVSTNKQGSTTLILEPLYELDYDIILIKKLTRVESQPDEEQVVFTFTNEEKDYTTNVVWAENEDERKIKLIPGKYKVESYVLDDSGFSVKIEKKTVERCVDVPKPILGILFGITDTKCIEEEIPETEIEQVLVGGANFEFEISRENLANNDKIVIYTLLDRTPSSYDDIEDVYSSLERKELGAAFKYPEFRK